LSVGDDTPGPATAADTPDGSHMAGKHTASSSPTRSPMRTWLLGVAVMFAVRIAGDYAALMGATGWLWTTRLSELWLAGGRRGCWASPSCSAGGAPATLRP